MVDTAGAVVPVRMQGTPVVPGVVYAPAVRPAKANLELGAEGDLAEVDRAPESERFLLAANAVAERLRQRASRSSGVAAEVLSANAAMAEDRGWAGAAAARIAGGMPATHAVVAATAQFTAMFEKLGGMMAERVTDLLDVRDRVLAELLGEAEPGMPLPEVPSVLVADDLAPADTAGLPPGMIIGLATERGGPTSHTAIIARQLGIPCVVAVPGLGGVVAGSWLLIDGDTGEVVDGPDPEVARVRVAASEVDRRAAEGWTGPGRTSDGHPVQLLANVQDGPSAQASTSSPAEGVGLLRTELAFLDREAEPSIAEQAEIYGQVLHAFDGLKVVIRTLDAGSDKPLRFVTHPDEANPALGVRGVRIAIAEPHILERQLDAIVEAAKGASVAPWVMAPMIATIAEAREFAAQVRGRGLVAGVMVEVPAVALLADKVLAEVDFVSIGTNDLAQYAMAADRMSAELASLTDPWQPAVLALISAVAEAGGRAGKPVGVCGEAAADPLLAGVLVGMGVTSLSSAPTAIRPVGAALAAVTLAQCQAAARAALDTESPAAARAAALGILRP
ncbi:phosphoenolpyruvate--protein phosphotransferase [Tomitella biformata]|uniref:phosphoenolpyruvate--protein phosphotransferase n=1 Tax=Tomitella biformata TaxID=630403 RepID=UPI0004B94A73|nr:putative PEP-binding protein [Tomitella biformata]